MTSPRNPATLTALDTSVIGSWQIVGHSLRTGKSIDLTAFRGLPTTIGQFGFSDPFGAKQLQLTFPMVTIFDALGSGDLEWVADGASIEMIWHGQLPDNYPFGNPNIIKGGILMIPVVLDWKTGFRWEGYVASYDISTSSGLAISCAGAAYQLDKYEAKPEFPPRPYPYEYAIARQFRHKPHLRTKHLKIVWPSNWSNIYKAPGKHTPSYELPVGVTTGDPWTGLLTRSTGNWEATLTSYIQTILSSMYTPNGRWTMDMVQGRQPLLVHRDMRTSPGPATVSIDASAPANIIDVSMDWSQSLDVVYGQGTALDGVAFSGMEVSSSGAETWYEPFAYRRQAFPDTHNAWLDTRTMPTEIMLQLQQGIDPAGAQLVAANHLRRFADPGLTGTITLGTDVTMDGVPLSRYLVRAGMDCAVPGLLGRPEPTLFHITDNTCDLVAGTNQLTVDSKFRDALTVKEVKLRGRDALKIPRMLVGGQYTPPVPDQLVPWNYHKGSGYIPSGHKTSCVELFDGIPDNIVFPWVDWTTARPPSSHHWRNSYIKIGGGADAKAANNWAYRNGGPVSGRHGLTIMAAQVATIRLLQVAAYHADGTIFKVPFHISFYTYNAVNIAAMPELTSADVADGSNVSSSGTHYADGSYYPFGTDAWETYQSDGTQTNPQVPHAYQTGLLRAYGTRFNQAGMYPGSGSVFADGGSNTATGLLVDEAQWSIDTTQESNAPINVYIPKKDQTGPVGRIYAMVYCDAQGGEDVYFLGRMFRVEPGTGS